MLPKATSQDSHASHADMQEDAENGIIDDDHQSNGSSETEMIYYTKQQQLFSLVIKISTSPDYSNGKIIKFLKQTRNFLITDQELGPNIRHISEILPNFQKFIKETELCNLMLLFFTFFYHSHDFFIDVNSCFYTSFFSSSTFVVNCNNRQMLLN
jgi:hypothetical protein